MSRDTIDSAKEETETPSTLKTDWTRVTLAGVVTGDPPRVTFHIALTLPNGNQRHLTQTVRVTDESLLMRLLKIRPGAEIRVCTETDWAAKDIPTVLQDFCLV